MAGKAKTGAVYSGVPSEDDPCPFNRGAATNPARPGPSGRRASVNALKAGLDSGASGGAAPVATSAPPNRRDSQAMFASRNQSIIIFDWDDTLFPTTFVRIDQGLKWNVALKDQAISAADMKSVEKTLKSCEDAAIALLQSACMMGQVMIVTLARSPWLDISCQNFYPRMGKAIEELRVPRIYAQEGVVVDQRKVNAMTEAEHEAFWSGLKGKAIEKALQEFYSQYEGQSWKNIISIGDSDFERLGTIAAVESYLASKGMSAGTTEKVVDGHVIKVRAKTFKLVDEPSCDELHLQVLKLNQWLPLMVRLDQSFDINIATLDNPGDLERIERTLAGK